MTAGLFLALTTVAALATGWFVGWMAGYQEGANDAEGWFDSANE